MVTVAVADFVLSVTEVATTLRLAGLGAVFGAVYRTLVGVMLESVPQAAPVQPAPERLQVTPKLEGSFCTLAVKDCVVPAATMGAVGETVTEIGPVVKLTPLL